MTDTAKMRVGRRARESSRPPPTMSELEQSHVLDDEFVPPLIADRLPSLKRWLNDLDEMDVSQHGNLVEAVRWLIEAVEAARHGEASAQLEASKIYRELSHARGRIRDLEATASGSSGSAAT